MNYLTNFNQNIIGSDEVGVGDYFGPLVVTAVKIPKKNLGAIINIGIKDSKLLTNKEIKQIAKQVMPLVLHSTRWLIPYSYNEMFDKYKNSHILKTLLHNQVQSKYADASTIHIIDAYASKENYLKYLDKIDEKIKIDNIILEKKAEGKYIQVAIAAIIARKKFNEWFKDQEVKYGTLPFGANQHVKDKVIDIKKQYGNKGLAELTKKHFKI